MASTGLSSLISNTGTQTTALPSWYDTAQQNVVSQAQAANAAAPAPGQTVAQNAVNALSGPTNAFTQAGGTLQNIASGAANPWNTDASGNVTPNTNTALGGLFQAQNQQLNQLMPTTTAPVEAGNIGSGNFGGLRGQTAVDTSKANALATLNTAQNQAALQNQATGVNAGAAAGNVAQQDINNLLTTGQYQQASPYTNAANLGNVLSSIQAPQTVSNTTNLSPLNQVMGLASALGGSGVSTSGLLGSLFGTTANGQSPTLANGSPNPAYVGASAGWLSQLSTILGGSGSTSNGGSGLPTGQTISGTDPTTGLPTYTNSSGQAVDQFGNTSGLPTGQTISGTDPTTGLPTYSNSSGQAVDQFGNTADTSATPFAGTTFMPDGSAIS